MQCSARALLLLVCTFAHAVGWCADATAPPASAWYCFESPQALGRSTGMTPWPAYALGASLGPGKAGSGLVIPGVGGNGLYLPNPVSFFGAEARRGTIALWVKPAFAPAEEKGQRVLFDFMCQTRNTRIDGYEIALFTDGTHLKAKPCLDRQMQIGTPLRQGEWTHLALTWDCGAGTAFYVDGERRAERKGAFAPTVLERGWPGRVGCHTPGGGFPFAGTLDNLRLFNTCLSDGEVRSLCGAEPAGAALRVDGLFPTGAGGRRPAPAAPITVRNAGGEPVTVALQVWSADGKGAFPHTGYLPFPFAAAGPEVTYWTAGASPARPIGQAVQLLPGTSILLQPPAQRSMLGRRRIRVVAGEGLSAAEVAGLDFGGLSFDVAGFAPRVFVAGKPVPLRVRVQNGLGRAFVGAVVVDLLDNSGRRLDSSRHPVKLPQGGRAEFLRTGPKLVPGAYRVKLSALEAGRQTLLNEVPVYATAPGNARTLCDVAAAFVHAPRDADVLKAMARDGVVALRQNGGIADFDNSDRSLAAALEHGLKAWRMPAASYRSVCMQASQVENHRRTARNLGLYLRDNPAVLNQVIGGEGLSCPPCYCAACTASFRDALRKCYGSLGALNQAWATRYASWDEIQPLGSPRDIDETAERLKMMKVALDLPAANTARWRKLFELDRPRAMAWKRWHEGKLAGWYAEFANAFHAANGGRTPLSEQPCWPNFESHILFALGRIADMGGMDLYLPGEGPTTLGYAAELFLNFDMNASIFLPQGKPLMVHELYVQDNSGPLLPEAQGWWLVGRGYNLLSYFTYDHYYEGVRSGQPLIFGLFDKGGRPYPTYASFLRLGKAIKVFNTRYPCGTFRREAPRVALFMGDDVSLANNLESGGATWEAAGVHGHNGAYWLTERSGYPVEFINDTSFDRLAGKRALIIPWCHVIRPSSIERILAFARAGGTVILDGPLGLYDHRYLPYRPLPGGALSSALGVTFAGYEDRPNAIALREGVSLPTQGVPVEPKVGRGEVLLRDGEGRPALVRVTVGKGKVLFLLTSLGRRSLARAPEREAITLWTRLLAGNAGIQPRCRLVPAGEAGAGVGLLGAAPGGAKPSLFDVSVRLRGQNEAFLFLTSYFGPTRGSLGIALPAGTYEAADACSGAAVPLSRAGTRWSIPVELPADGSRVVRVRAAGRPFAGW